MAFFLFLLVNATLFIRPAEILPAWEGLEVYFYCIVACLLVSTPDILRYLTEKPLLQQPITLMVFGIMVNIYVSGMFAVDAAESWRTGFYFTKIVLYYLLFVSLVTTAPRMRVLLLCILVNLVILTTLAVLCYHNMIEIGTVKPLTDNQEGKYGENMAIQRLQGTGFFKDPNELCVVLAAMMPFSIYFCALDRNLLFRFLCGIMLPLHGYAITLTQSRGGFLALIGGLGSLFLSRYGWKKTVLISIVGVPLLLLAFGSRQTDISTSTGTVRTRISLWQEWFTIFRDHPMIGNGMYLHVDEDAALKRKLGTFRQVAHSSFLQCYADLGLVGGTLFIGAFVAALWSVHRFNPAYCLHANRDLKQIQPFVLACLVAYCLGMYSLTISFIIPTFLILALAVSYTNIAQRSCLAAPPPLRADDPRLLGAILAAGICFLISIYIFTRMYA